MKLVKTTDNQEYTQERNLEFLGNTGGWAKMRNSCVDLQINTTHISSMLTEPEICTAIQLRYLNDLLYSLQLKYLKVI